MFPMLVACLLRQQTKMVLSLKLCKGLATFWNAPLIASKASGPRLARAASRVAAKVSRLASVPRVNLSSVVSLAVLRSKPLIATASFVPWTALKALGVSSVHALSVAVVAPARAVAPSLPLPTVARFAVPHPKLMTATRSPALLIAWLVTGASPPTILVLHAAFPVVLARTPIPALSFSLCTAVRLVLSPLRSWTATTAPAPFTAM